ncbi:MAG: cation-translocating P-type ATPase [Candidatus Micrarchaeota archaeon]|nr:cation-translocating P-type ATPase [Candidatus Micrarchaeota archaeon]
MVEAHHLLSVNETFRILNTSKKGLSSSEAKSRLSKYGFNEIQEKRKKSDIEIFIDQFRSFLILILIAATILSFAFGEYIDAVLISLIILLNASLGFIQAKKAEEAVAALKKLTVPTVKVLRDGEVKTVSSREIVPGDIVILDTGDRVPADCRIISHINLKVDESVLTGESVPISKTSDQLKSPQPIQNQSNMVFMGTSIVYGRCEAVVVTTGMNTEFGKIALSIQQGEEITPLQKKLDDFGKFIGKVFLFICGVVFVIGLINGMEFITISLTAISLAVAAVPEGLLASITIALSLGVSTMAKHKAIVRKLTAVEGLGSVTVICTDKTGTLTVNEMTVKRIWTMDKEYSLTGEGYKKDGKILFRNKEIKQIPKDLELTLKSGLYCNNAFVNGDPIGDPTEIALIISARKAGLEDKRPDAARLDEIQFDSERKMMSVLYKEDSRNTIWVKGATERVINRCRYVMKEGRLVRLTDSYKKKILEKEKEYASSSFRVLAFAMKSTTSNKIVENNLVFLGMQAMIDPPRPEVKDAIATCKKAGIDVIMITGDHKETAIAIGKELGILNNGLAITGAELDAMSDSELKEKISDVKVFARVSPEHKVRITRILKEKGHIVAMTGDGINDAPALKAADIGVAMGQTGTDVTREVADLVIADDNFATIVKAVEQGRGIYDNIKKTVAFLLSGNIAEILIIFLAVLIGLPLPLVAIQILWINLVTDGLPALALAVDPISRDVMNKKPRNPKEDITYNLDIYLIHYPIILTFFSLLVFIYFLQTSDNLAKAQTATFTLVVLFEIFQSFACRSLDAPVGREFANNKYLLIAAGVAFVLQMFILYFEPMQILFDTRPLTISELMALIGISLIGFAYIEFAKYKAKK